MHETADFHINRVSTAYAHYALSILFLPPSRRRLCPFPPTCVQVTVECKYCITANCSLLASNNSEPEVILFFVLKKGH
jgi:hypothetical protein